MENRFSGYLLGHRLYMWLSREWNQRQKHKKQPWSNVECFAFGVGLCALRHWKRVSMPPTTQSLRHPLTRAFHFAPRIKTARRFTAKNP